MSKDDNDGVAGVPACFFFANSVAKTTTGFNVCKACELVTGPGGIDGGQKLFGLWRIYCTSTKARNNLITNGITIDDQFIPIIGVNPKVVKGASDNPSVKVIIGNIAKSVSNEEIEKALKTIEGVKIRSKMFDEHYRDEEGKLSLFKSGRRFIYIDAPPKPLPTQFQVGKWTPSLYHYGQKVKDDKKSNSTSLDTEAKNIGAADISVETHQPNEKELVSDTQNSQSSATLNSGKQTNIEKFFDTTPSPSTHNRQSRPVSRIPSRKSRTHSDSASRKRGLAVKDPLLAPFRKSQRTDNTSSIDYFDFTPLSAEPKASGDGSID